MVANNLAGVCESLLYGHKAGVNLDQMVNLLKKGGAASFYLENIGPRILRRDFEPGFYVEHFVKDLGIAAEESKRLGITLPSTTLIT
mmetsp:Transcript_106119/g.158762  ORF Transcript_106119/g.158762 Transcript_106119/m.158762 type:complete len:87 (+) Transcript_106119:163-423(+)